MVSVGACGTNGAGKERKKHERVKKIQKVLKEGTVDDSLEDLEVQLPSFLEHVFVKRQPARIFKEKIEHLTEEEAVVQVDFAEKFQLQVPGRSSVSTLEPRPSYPVHCCNLDKVWRQKQLL